MQEKVDVQRQAQKDHAELQQQVKELEVELEEQVRTRTKLEENHLTEVTDLQQRLHALEKQLENNRRFLDVCWLLSRGLGIFSGARFTKLPPSCRFFDHF